VTELLLAWSQGDRAALDALVDVHSMQWQNRAQFFAHRRGAHEKHSRRPRTIAPYRNAAAARRRSTLVEGLVTSPARGTDLIALDDALKELARPDPRRGQVVELRFFGGLTVEETAATLKVSPETVMRDWKLAKSWLMRELEKS
jgi:DNA-directed RNA polymerase specialized sigma24 family protein